MNTPEGKRPLAAIEADIKQWLAEHWNGAECNTCGAIIQQTTLYASVHEGAAMFGGRCVGGGQVVNLALPYCNTCEPDVAGTMQRTCIHPEVPHE